jgi:hypothetical protein
LGALCRKLVLWLGINERAEKVLHFLCGWTNRGEDNVFDKRSQRIFRKKGKRRWWKEMEIDLKLGDGGLGSRSKWLWVDFLVLVELEAGRRASTGRQGLGWWRSEF